MSTEESTDKEKTTPEPEASQPKEQAGEKQTAPAAEAKPAEPKADAPTKEAAPVKKEEGAKESAAPEKAASSAPAPAKPEEKAPPKPAGETPAKTEQPAEKQAPVKLEPKKPSTVGKPAVNVGTGVARNKVQTGMPEVGPLLQMLADCAAACKRCLDEFTKGGTTQKFEDAKHACQACLEICNLLHGWASNIAETGHTRLAMDLALVCARACETCHVACVKHPGESYCVATARISLACANQCRSFAKA